MPNTLHPLLLRQLKRSGIDIENLPENFDEFVRAVNIAYQSSDQDRLLLERSLELSSQEVHEQNQEMRSTLELLPRIFGKADLANEGLSLKDLLVKHVEELKVSQVSLSKQAELLREQAFELAVARDEALESSKAKSAFLANMSHEIRTPMNATLGMLKIVLGTELKNDQREYLNLAEQASLGLLSLIEDILDLSKIEAGKLDIESIEFKPRHTIKSVLATAYSQASTKGVELFAKIDPNLPRKLVGDPNRLKQVLLNLISNAVKFTSSGYVLLEVLYLGDNDRGDSRVLFSVKDTGIGIAPDKQEEVFSAFQQVDQSITRNYGGTGLGLSISQQLIGMLGGKIKLESTLGEGSRFYFELAIPQAKDGDTLSVARLGSYEEKNFSVITEKPVLGELIFSHLSKFNQNHLKFKIFTPDEIYSSGKKPKGVVFFDIGFGLTLKNRFILEALSKAECKIVVVASMFDLSERETFLNLGAKAIMFKPFIDSDIDMALRKVLNEDVESLNAGAEAFNQTVIQQSLRIVVVDDLHVNRLVAQKTLEQRGHEVICFEGGRQLLDHLKNEKQFSWERSGNSEACDIILLDVQMPELDGMETARLVRSWEVENSIDVSRHLPIVALTAHALKGDRERFIESGMDDYLRKPIDVDALSLILNRIREGREESEVVDLNLEPERPKLTISFDREQLFSRFGGDLDSVREIIEAFLEEEQELIQNLDMSLEAEDSERIRKSAHALKGSLLNVCGIVAGEIASELEMVAKEKVGGYRELVKRLKAESCLLKIELEKMINLPSF